MGETEYKKKTNGNYIVPVPKQNIFGFLWKKKKQNKKNKKSWSRAMKKVGQCG